MTTPTSYSASGSRRGSGGGGGARTPGRCGSADASQRDSPSLSVTSCLRWAECPQNLLDDPEGVLLLKQFMEDMNPSHARAFDFYFAVKGLKSGRQPGWENPRKLVRLINKTYVSREGCVPISAAARLAIQARVRSGDSDPGVFDPALDEVVHFLTHTVYPAFLKSDLYVNYLACVSGSAPHHQQLQMSGCLTGGGEPATSGSPVVVHTPRSLPTLHEDRELPQQLQAAAVAAAASAVVVGRAGSVPRSSSSSRVPPAAAPAPAPAASAGPVLDLTSYNLYATRFQRGRASLPEFVPGGGPTGQSGSVCYSMSQAALPYHTSYAPGSKQDSELQSLSSDALTDDTVSQADTVSSFEAAAAVAAAAVNAAAGRRGLRRAVKRSADLNKEDPRAAIIPRPSGPPGAACDPASSPSEFASLLTEKLLAHQRDLDRTERLAQAIGRPDRPAAAAAGGGGGLGVLSSPWAQRILARSFSSERAEAHNPELILDNHLETVFDRTPPQQPATTQPLLDAEHVHHYHYHHHYGSQAKSVSSVADSGLGTVSSRGHNRLSAPPPLPPPPPPPPQPPLPLPLPMAPPPLQFAGPAAATTTQRQLNLHVSQHAGTGPRQPFACDPNMPLVDKPLTDNVIVEARRRLEEMSISASSADVASSSASSATSVVAAFGAPGGSAAAPPQLTIGYFLFGESVPYRHAWSGREITLGQFKQLIAKKGSFRYFFKKRSDEFVVGGAVQEEVTDDAEVLPLWEGKVVAKVEKFE